MNHVDWLSNSAVSSPLSIGFSGTAHTLRWTNLVLNPRILLSVSVSSLFPIAFRALSFNQVYTTTSTAKHKANSHHTLYSRFGVNTEAGDLPPVISPSNLPPVISPLNSPVISPSKFPQWFPRWFNPGDFPPWFPALISSPVISLWWIGKVIKVDKLSQFLRPLFWDHRGKSPGGDHRGEITREITRGNHLDS